MNIVRLFCLIALSVLATAQEQTQTAAKPGIVKVEIAPDTVVRLTTALNRTTTIQFPFKIADLHGMGFTRNSEPADFLIGLQEGEATTISISPLRKGGARNLNVIAQDGSIYVLDFSVGDPESAPLVVQFIKK